MYCLGWFCTSCQYTNAKEADRCGRSSCQLKKTIVGLSIGQRRLDAKKHSLAHVQVDASLHSIDNCAAKKVETTRKTTRKTKRKTKRNVKNINKSNMGNDDITTQELEKLADDIMGCYKITIEDIAQQISISDLEKLVAALRR